jgi:hypothetical protein
MKFTASFITKRFQERYMRENAVNYFFSVPGQIVCVRSRAFLLARICLSKSMINVREYAVMWQMFLGVILDKYDETLQFLSLRHMRNAYQAIPSN